MYDLNDNFSAGWQVQGGYTHKVSRDQSGAKVGTYEPEDQLSLYTSYKLGGSLDNLSAPLNLNNAFDKKYQTNIGFFNAAYYGDPRNLMLTTRWDF